MEQNEKMRDRLRKETTVHPVSPRRTKSNTKQHQVIATDWDSFAFYAS